MNTPAAPFPPISLHPVMNAHHVWSALLLEVPGPFDATALVQLFGEFGLFETLDALPCIVALNDPADLSDETAELLPADRIILRIPAAVCVDAARSEDLKRLRQAGFRLMADGLPPAGPPPCGAVESVALACPEGLPPANAAALAHLPGPHLALGVKTHEQHDRCRHAGFGWFAGHCIPQAEKGGGAASPHHQALLLRLLSMIAADADSHEMEAIFKQDAHLSYQLLKLVNSVAFSLTKKIASFNQAITLLGRRQLQRWLQLLLYAHAQGGEPNPLMPRAALRAELMESLCTATGGAKETQDHAFMVGMFSLLDLLFGMTIAEIVSPLNLADDVARALTERSGRLGALLCLVEAGEKGSEEARLADALAAAGIDTGTWAKSLVQAYRWAIPISREA